MSGIRSSFKCANLACQLKVHIRFIRSVEQFFFTVFGECTYNNQSQEKLNLLKNKLKSLKHNKQVKKLEGHYETFQQAFDEGKRTGQKLK